MVKVMANPVGELKCRPLGFWNKAMPSAMRIIYLLKNNLWGLVEASFLTMMVPQVTI